MLAFQPLIEADGVSFICKNLTCKSYARDEKNQGVEGHEENPAVDPGGLVRDHLQDSELPVLSKPCSMARPIDLGASVKWSGPLRKNEEIQRLGSIRDEGTSYSSQLCSESTHWTPRCESAPYPC